MTFAKLYKDHAYADLIQEAETQGIGIGVQSERSRIIKLLEDYQHPNTQHEFNDEFCDSLIALINGDNK